MAGKLLVNPARAGRPVHPQKAVRTRRSRPIPHRAGQFLRRLADVFCHRPRNGPRRDPHVANRAVAALCHTGGKRARSHSFSTTGGVRPVVPRNACTGSKTSHEPQLRWRRTRSTYARSGFPPPPKDGPPRVWYRNARKRTHSSGVPEVYTSYPLYVTSVEDCKRKDKLVCACLFAGVCRAIQLR